MSLEDRLVEKKVGDSVGKMNFATFGVYSIGFHFSSDFASMDIFFQIFFIIVQKCKHRACSSCIVFLSFHQIVHLLWH
jgi:hypothetical protein